MHTYDVIILFGFSFNSAVPSSLSFFLGIMRVNGQHWSLSIHAAHCSG